MFVAHLDNGKHLHQNIPFPLDVLGAKYEYLMMKALGKLNDTEWLYRFAPTRRFIHWLANSVVLPLVHGEVVTLQEVENLVRRLEREGCTIAVGICECRHGEGNVASGLEDGRDPNLTCVMIGDWGRGHLYSYPEHYRRISADDLLDRTRYWFGKGRVLSAWGVKDLHGFMVSYCHCRPDYCVPLRNQRMRGNEVFLKGYHVARLDEDRCAGTASCGWDCVGRCYFDAIRVLDSRVEIDASACHGCGQCVAFCPNGAVEEVAREGYQLVYSTRDLVAPLEDERPRG